MEHAVDKQSEIDADKHQLGNAYEKDVGMAWGARS